MADANDLLCGFCTIVNAFALPAAAIGAGIGGVVAIGDPNRVGEITRGAAWGAGIGFVTGIAALVAYNAQQLHRAQQQRAMAAPYPGVPPTTA